MRCLSALACIVLAFNPALACESPPAAEAFVYENDLNLDGALDINEWKSVKGIKNFRAKFGDFSKDEFDRLDKNKDGKLEWENELEGNIEYIKDPCEIIKEKQDSSKKSKNR